MASLDNLQPDQRAVLQMVLQRGRSYDEIANLLGIERGAVRQRALDALDVLTPMAVIPGPERALVTDYLLGQLPVMVAEQVRGYLAASEPDREWGAALSRLLAPLAPGAMPEIPDGARPGPDGASGGTQAHVSPRIESVHAADELRRRAADVDAGVSPAPEPSRATESEADPVEPTDPRADEEELIPGPPPPRVPTASPASPTAPPPSGRARERPGRQHEPKPRRGSAASGGRLWAWAVLTVAIIAAVVVVVATSGSSKPAQRSTRAHTNTVPTTATRTDTSTPTSTSTTGESSTHTQTTPAVRRLALLHLSSPNGASGTAGIAQVVRSRGIDTVVITAQGLPANTAHDAYAVWLSNSLSDSVMIGWVQALVSRNGQLSTEGTLPAGAGRYHRVLVTLETQAKPTEPGEIVLAGVFREHS